MFTIPVNGSQSLYKRGYGPPDKRFLNPDGSATSRVFKLRKVDEGKLSVDVKELTTPEKGIRDKTQFVLFEITVHSVIVADLTAFYDPIDVNPAHAYIWGLDIDDDIKPGLLARSSKRVWFN